MSNIDEVEIQGFEVGANWAATDWFSLSAGFNYTDSEIQKAADPSWVGNQAPLVSEYTLNLGLLYQRPTNFFGGVNGVMRVDYQRTGDTWWDPGNISVRSPINLLDMRVGVDVADNWSLMLWAKNLTDERYNGELSPGPAPTANFLWPAQPRRWGASFVKQF